MCPSGLTPGIGVALPKNGTLTFFMDSAFSGRTDIYRSFGADTDIPVFGDFQGTTITNIGIYRPSTGGWALDTANNGSVGKTLQLGGPGWVPVTGDVNGDGKTDVGVYNPSNGVWAFSTDLSGKISVAFGYGGTPGDIPLMADFNHDGIDDPVIYNNGQWLVDTNADRIPDQIYRMGGGANGIPLTLDLNGTHDPALVVVSPQADGQFRWAINPNRDGKSIGYYVYGARGTVPFGGYFPTAKSIYVNPATGSDAAGAGPYWAPFKTINAAVAAASPGSDIRLASGVYRENVSVASKSDLKFVGAGLRSTIIQPAANDAFFVYRSSNIAFDDLWVSSPGKDGRGIVALASSVDTGLIQTNLTSWVGLLAGSEGGTPARVNARYSHFDGVTIGTGIYLDNGVTADLYGITASENGLAKGFRADSGGLVVGGTSYAKVDKSSFVHNQNYGVTTNSTARLEMYNSYAARSIIGFGAILFNASTGVFIGNTFAENGVTFGPVAGMNGIEIAYNFVGYAHIQGNRFINNTANGLYIGSAPNEIQIIGNEFSGNWAGISFFGDQPRDSYARIVANHFTIPPDFPEVTFGVAGIGSRIHATIGGPGNQANVFDGYRDYLSIIGNNAGGDPYLVLGYPKFNILKNTYMRRGVAIPESRAILNPS
jgi:parallel beta-helix repeat protein